MEQELEEVATDGERVKDIAGLVEYGEEMLRGSIKKRIEIIEGYSKKIGSTGFCENYPEKAENMGREIVYAMDDYLTDRGQLWKFGLDGDKEYDSNVMNAINTMRDILNEVGHNERLRRIFDEIIRAYQRAFESHRRRPKQE